MDLVKHGLAAGHFACHEPSPVNTVIDLGGHRRGRPPRAELTQKRCWRLYNGLSVLVDHTHRATSRQVQKLIAHITFAGLTRRELPSMLRASYDIARDFKNFDMLWFDIETRMNQLYMEMN